MTLEAEVNVCANDTEDGDSVASYTMASPSGGKLHVWYVDISIKNYMEKKF